MDWSLNGYGTFVWPSYGITALVLGGLVWWSVRSYLRARDAVRAQRQAEESGE